MAGHQIGSTGRPLKSWAAAWLHDQIRPRLTKELNEIHLLPMIGQRVPGI